MSVIVESCDETHRLIERLEQRIAPAFAAIVELSGLNGLNGFTLLGPAGSRSGFSVSDAGDINGDDIADLIIGAPDGGSGARGAYVVFGKGDDFAAQQDLSTLDGTNGFRISGVTDVGRSVSRAGDINGDGFDDLLVGTIGGVGEGGFERASYVVFGKRTGFPATFNLSTLDGTNGFKLSLPLPHRSGSKRRWRFQWRRLWRSHYWHTEQAAKSNRLCRFR